MVYAFDANTGKLKWEREAHKGAPFGGRHRKNTFASETPATDGERLYAYFGNVGLFAYSLDGKPLWTTRFDPQPMYLDFGTAASPVVHDGRVFVVHDNDGKSFVAAVDARTGKQLWKVERDLPAPHGLGMVVAVHLGRRPRTRSERRNAINARAHRDRPLARGVVRPGDRQGVVADARPDRPVDAEPGRRRRTALPRDRIAG